jgi:flagellin
VDLSRSTVDSQTLGLKGVQAINDTTYDLGASSLTSVENIIIDNADTTATFKFNGPGFGDPSIPIQVDVNLTGIGDTGALVDGINNAIAAAGNAATSAAAKFKAANITASVTTDSNGNQMLAFSSSSTAFEVSAGDPVTNALMGNFVDATSDADGQTASTVTTTSTGVNFAGDYTFVVRYGDGSTSTALVTNVQGATDAVTALNSADITVTGTAGGPLTFTSNSARAHAGFTISAIDTTLLTPVDVSSVMGFETLSVGPALGKMVSGGSYQLADNTGTTKKLDWVDLGATAKQSITVSANDAQGVAHSVTVNLAGTTTKVDALKSINDALQATNDSTLQQVTAAHDSEGFGITFMSNVPDFTVSAGLSTDTAGAASAGLGLTDGSGAGFSYGSKQVGQGNAADISSSAGAKAAISAITLAVQQLGTAQAAVGKGQNQLGYAIGLANSQISNFSAAQAQIRDADVAAEAANLTKAQVLQQATLAAMAQANSAPQSVLSLLKG